MPVLPIRPPERGILLVISGPSGVGKSTIVRAVMRRVPGWAFSVSATTRGPREGEVDGVDYHFMDRSEFDALVERGAFLEHATVYDRSYGTLLGPTEEALAAGKSLILDIDAQGSRSVRARLPEAVHIMVVPPNLAVLEQRLRARGTDDDAVIARRMAQVMGQLSAASEYDYLVVNDDLSVAERVFEGILLAEMSRVRRSPRFARKMSGCE